MTDDPTSSSDAELVAQIRAGSDGAVDELLRRHLHALQTVSAGYLRTDRNRDETIRTVVESIGHQPLPSDDDGEVIIALFAALREHKLREEASPTTGLIETFEQSGIGNAQHRQAFVQAFGELDERDQVLIWFSTIESALPPQLADRLSIRGADLAATMTHRARGRLRRRYLEQRLDQAPHFIECDVTAESILRAVDGEYTLDSEQYAHVVQCARCSLLAKELVAVPSLLLRAVHSPTPTQLDVSTALPTTVPAAASASTAITPVTSEPDDDLSDEEELLGGHRRASAVVGIAIVIVVLLIAGVLWKLSTHTPSEPVHAGPLTTVERISAPTHATTSTSTRASSSTSSTSTTSSTSSTTSTSIVTRSPEGTGGPVWHPPHATTVAPPTTNRPGTTAPAHPTTVVPPTTPAPTTPPPTTVPPTSEP